MKRAAANTICSNTLTRRVTSAQGFTLIELLATLVLIAIVLPAVMKGISLATTTARLTQQRSIATTLADNLLADILLTKAWQDGDMTGDFQEQGYADFAWESQVVDWQGVTVQQLTVTVNWTLRNQPRFISLTTLVYLEAG